MRCKYAARAALELAELKDDTDASFIEEDGENRVVGGNIWMGEETAEEEKGTPGDETDVDGKMPTSGEWSDVEMKRAAEKRMTLGHESDVDSIDVEKQRRMLSKIPSARENEKAIDKEIEAGGSKEER